ncbi:hypothetical protein [Lactobacillus acetotolerans]|jgi:hypothetical protein|uniref:hypothetical protein n=1 Tax=Lactobacillus acetotolerans TaxID=1600 RepID=UPI00241FFDB0|nr:hypothetical protein [Lactobacillus acetotolerans]
MSKKIILNNEKIFCASLFILALLNGLSRLAVFNENNLFANLENYIQLPIYLVLVFLIIQKNFSLDQYLLILTIGILIVIGYFDSKMAGFLRAFLLILAAKNFELKKILKSCRYALIITVIISVILFLFGISVGSVRRNFISWGFVHPNVAGQVMMLVVLLWVSENEDIKKIDTMLFWGAVIIGAFTGARTPAILLIALILMLPILKYVVSKQNFVADILCYLNPFLLWLTYYTANKLDVSQFAQLMDKILVNRIFLNYFALNRWGIKLFGQDISLTTTGTVYNNIRNVYWTTGTTVDSTYMTSLLVMGLLSTVIWSISYIFTMKKMKENKNYLLLGVAIILCFEAFTETGMIEIYNNFVLFYLTATVSNLQDKQVGEKYAK